MLGHGHREDSDERLELISASAGDLLNSTNALIELLRTHRETTWAANFSQFRDQLRGARSKKDLNEALLLLQSFYGGMGSWNDVYLVALGDAEAERCRLSGAISMSSASLLELLESVPDTPKKSIWTSLKRWFVT